MKGRIPFNAWSRERIKEGKKICTSRKEIYKDERVTWISPQLPWVFIKTFLWEAEGANSPEELQKVINKIFRREVKDDELFYVHMGDFREIKE